MAKVARKATQIHEKTLGLKYLRLFWHAWGCQGFVFVSWGSPGVFSGALPDALWAFSQHITSLADARRGVRLYNTKP